MKKTEPNAPVKDNKIKSYIPKQARSRNDERMTAYWDEYRNSRVWSADIPVFREEWGPEAWGFYKKLNRPNSTILLQCRTGHTGLRFKLHQIRRADSPKCDCGTSDETARHLFLHCPLLSDERTDLGRELGQLSLYAMLTHQADIATTWALRNFNIKQFKSVRATLNNSSSSPSGPPRW